VIIDKISKKNLNPQSIKNNSLHSCKFQASIFPTKNRTKIKPLTILAFYFQILLTYSYNYKIAEQEEAIK